MQYCTSHSYEVSQLCARAGKSNQEILEINVLADNIYRPVHVCVDVMSSGRAFHDL